MELKTYSEQAEGIAYTIQDAVDRAHRAAAEVEAYWGALVEAHPHLEQCEAADLLRVRIENLPSEMPCSAGTDEVVDWITDGPNFNRDLYTAEGHAMDGDYRKAYRVLAEALGGRLPGERMLTSWEAA